MFDDHGFVASPLTGRVYGSARPAWWMLGSTPRLGHRPHWRSTLTIWQHADHLRRVGPMRTAWPCGCRDSSGTCRSVHRSCCRAAWPDRAPTFRLGSGWQPDSSRSTCPCNGHSRRRAESMSPCRRSKGFPTPGHVYSAPLAPFFQVRGGGRSMPFVLALAFGCLTGSWLPGSWLTGNWLVWLIWLALSWLAAWLPWH